METVCVVWMGSNSIKSYFGVFEDEAALTRLDDESGEERNVTLGSDRMGRLVVVVYAWRGERIRIISARAAEPRERRRYEQGQ